VGGPGVDAEPLLRLVTLGEVAPEILAIDIDSLEVAARILDAARQAFLDVVGQGREQVRRLHEVRVARVCPQLPLYQVTHDASSQRTGNIFPLNMQMMFSYRCPCQVPRKDQV